MEVAGLSGTLTSVRGELKDVQSQVKTLTDNQQTELARRQQAEKDLMLALEATSKATRQGVAEDIKKGPLKVWVSGAGGHSDEEKKKRAAVRAELGNFMSEARSLMNFCVKPPSPNFSCENAVTQWNMKCLTYIRENVESSYAARFSSASGLSMSWSGVDDKTNNILNFLKNHTEVLEQFIKELLD